MLRIILGVIVGFIVWSILWVGSDILLANLSPGWWGKNLFEMDAAVKHQTAYTTDSTLLMISLCRSVICSLIAGLVAAAIAGENSRSTLILGILLLAFGIFIQSIYWNIVPLWYHFTFLFLLVPITIMGGKLRKTGMSRMQTA